MTIKPTVFAPMAYVRRVIEESGPGPFPERTKNYFILLQCIHDAQDNCSFALLELYQKLGGCGGKKALATVERGCYLANIHYYLFPGHYEFEKTEAYKDSVNARILFFLENADPEALRPYRWFADNFPLNYLRFLESFYGRQERKTDLGLKELTALVDRFGNETEKRIVGRLLCLCAD